MFKRLNELGHIMRTNDGILKYFSADMTDIKFENYNNIMNRVLFKARSVNNTVFSVKRLLTGPRSVMRHLLFLLFLGYLGLIEKHLTFRVFPVLLVRVTLST